MNNNNYFVSNNGLLKDMLLKLEKQEFKIPAQVPFIFKTGFEVIDTSLENFYKAPFNIICAPFYNFTLAKQIAINLGNSSDEKVLFIHTGLSSYEISYEIFKSECLIHDKTIINHSFTAENLDQISKSIEKISAANLLFNKEKIGSLDMLIKTIKEAVSKNKINSIFILGLDQMVTTEFPIHESFIANAIRALKIINQELNIPIFITLNAETKFQKKYRHSYRGTYNHVNSYKDIFPYLDTIVFLYHGWHFDPWIDESSSAEMIVFSKRDNLTKKKNLKYEPNQFTQLT